MPSRINKTPQPGSNQFGFVFVFVLAGTTVSNAMTSGVPEISIAGIVEGRKVGDEVSVGISAVAVKDTGVKVGRRVAINTGESVGEAGSVEVGIGESCRAESIWIKP